MTILENIYENIEIRFWRTVIPWMRSSEPARRLLNLGFQAVETYNPLPTFAKALVWITLGWIVGLVIGLVSAIII
jgi:hypothetical protein